MNILVAGATGLVGGLALPSLLARLPASARVMVVGRRLPTLADPRLVPVLGALDDPALYARLDAVLAEHPPEVFVSALGTTLRKAGSDRAFAALDRNVVEALARHARTHGARQAIVVSSVGADPRAAGLYLRVKGEMQAAVSALGFARVDFLQPGLLLGARTNDRRPAEALAQHLAPLLNPMLRGRLHRYRAIPAPTVAAALVALVGASGSGICMHRNDAMIELSRLGGVAIG